jgi:hypothetical protein
LCPWQEQENNCYRKAVAFVCVGAGKLPQLRQTSTAQRSRPKTVRHQRHPWQKPENSYYQI